MSKVYDDYLDAHIKAVNDFAIWCDNHGMFKEYAIKNGGEDISLLFLERHDESKFESDIYYAYDEYFYGDKNQEIIESFNYAWLKHQNQELHHWQYWVLVKDSGDVIPLDMPISYIIEMFCDWGSFAWIKNDILELIEWYDKNKNNMTLSIYTRGQVEYLIGLLKRYHENTGVRTFRYDPK